MAEPRKRLSTQEVLDAVLDSSDDDERPSFSLSDSDDFYQPFHSDSDSSDSSSTDFPSPNTDKLLQPPAPLAKTFHHPLSPLVVIENELHSPITIAIAGGNTDIPFSTDSCHFAAVNHSEPGTELILYLCEELPLPPAPSTLPPLSDTDSDDFPLPPPPSPLPPLMMFSSLLVFTSI